MMPSSHDTSSRLILLMLSLSLFLLPAGAAAGQDAGSALPAVADTDSATMMIEVRDTTTGKGIADARIFLDGGPAGVTTGNNGLLQLKAVPHGDHTVRATRRGYQENIIDINLQKSLTVTIPLQQLMVIPVGDQGPVEERIDVVFVPSSTQYDCTRQQKVFTDYYTSSEENFRKDVENLIEKRFFTLDTISSPSVGIPADFSTRFNFYYYVDPGDFADAFDGCAGKLPEDFWDDAPFTDVAIILYPQYVGLYKGPPCEPYGCSSTMGYGTHTWFKNPANGGMVFVHEAGHAIFGLMDTYCGETYYAQNDPYPNIWSTESACMQSAGSLGWDKKNCRQIAQISQSSGTTCQKNYWRWDPEPDLMSTVNTRSRFGNAATLHIRDDLEHVNRWNI